MSPLRRLARPFVAEAMRAWRRGGTPVRVAIGVGVVLMAVGLLHGAGFLLVGGPWVGPVAWRKPFAFGLSFGLTTVTVAWVVTRLRVGLRARWLLLTPLAVANTIEVAWVTVQRARGVPSHFNTATVADELAFTLAGGVAISVTVTVLVVLAVLSWVRPQAPPALASAMRSGLAILLTAQAVGGLMISRGVASLDAGGPASHAVAPAGDLKVAHAVAIHAIQVLPAVAVLLLAGHRSSAGGRNAVRLASAGYALLTAAALVQAASGRAVSDPTPVALALALAAMAVVGAVAAAAVVGARGGHTAAPVTG